MIDRIVRVISFIYLKIVSAFLLLSRLLNRVYLYIIIQMQYIPFQGCCVVYFQDQRNVKL